MTRGLLRRAMVFIDYSALRDSVRRFPAIRARRNQYAEIDFERLGRKLAGPDREFIRTLLYTAAPVAVEEREDGFFMNNVRVHEHEAHRARLVQRAFDDLKRQIDLRGPFTHLECGRMVLHRVELKHGPAFEWSQSVLGESRPDDGMAPEDAEFFRDAVAANSRAKATREELVERITALKNEGVIPSQYMPSFTWRISELLDEQLDFTEKGVDTRLTVQMLEHCMNDAFDDAILFAADEDYVPLVEAVKRTGRRVTHAFWDVPGPGFQLQRVCDETVLLGADDYAEVTPGS